MNMKKILFAIFVLLMCIANVKAQYSVPGLNEYDLNNYKPMYEEATAFDATQSQPLGVIKPFDYGNLGEAGAVSGSVTPSTPQGPEGYGTGVLGTPLQSGFWALLAMIAMLSAFRVRRVLKQQ